MWKPAVIYMQNWTGCDNLQLEHTITLTDIRDNNTYTVAKLKDGKCWMTQNLRIGGSTTMELTPEDTDIGQNYTLPASDLNSHQGLYVEPTYGGYYSLLVTEAGCMVQ